MSFHDIRIPQFIESFAVSRVEFATSYVSTLSGREARNLDREYSRQRYIIKNCRLSIDEFKIFSAFFRSRRGSYFSFRFRDNLDCQVSKQFIAQGDGNTRQFQLIKLYEDRVMSYTRIITKPVLDSCKLFINDINVEATVDCNTGLVDLSQPLGEEQILTASYSFDIETRFSNDSFNYHYHPDGSVELETELLEVI